ncbi:MAG: ATPase domain-containing protein [Candidatus Thermoplasmatota archaeon]|nr:ATPase domain-containing protein [Candidatus Thermoplasmatota archaeon]
MISYDRIKTYVSGLDEKMEGGIPKHYVVLISGPTGSMKSSLVFNILYNSARERKIKGLYLSLEQSRESLIRHMQKLNMNIENVKDYVTVMDLGKVRKEVGEEVVAAGFKIEEGRKISWIRSLKDQIENYKQMLRFEIVVIDSLDALCALSVMDNPRSEMFHFFEDLRSLGLTTFVVSEMPGESKLFGKYEIESFLSDGIIHLATERTGKTVGRYISVVKMRETKHPTDYFPLLVTERGFEIVTK